MEGEVTTITLRQVIEALLFAAREPLGPGEIRRVLKEALQFDPSDVTEALSKIKEGEILSEIAAWRDEIARSSQPWMIDEVVGGFQLATRPEYARWVRHLFEKPKSNRLSAPALETLAIIAYRQPISRAEVESIRGVTIDGVLSTLLERGLVRVAGRSDAPGRPVLYGTTEVFLQQFGIKDIADLPNSSELRRPAATPVAPVPEPEPSELPFENETPTTPPTDRPVGQSDPGAA